MIAYDLECSAGHVFEGWFDSSDSFDQQLARELVSCPLCGETRIRRVLSPVAVKKSVPTEPAQNSGPIDYRRLAREVVTYIQENFENVGPRFTAEALKMHYGVTEKRSIRGSATSQEEDTLRSEGIDFIKMPLPKSDDEDTN